MDNNTKDKLEYDHFNTRYMEEDNSKKKYTTSKTQLAITGVIFISICLFVAGLYLTGKITDVYDVAALVTMISVSGAIFGSNLCWYSKKSASENHYKLRMALYHDSTRVRLNYNEAMIKMMKHYGVTEADLNKIDESGDIDEMMASAINSVISDLDATQDDVDSKNEIESFGC